jgi:hypothetical protein
VPFPKFADFSLSSSTGQPRARPRLALPLTCKFVFTDHLPATCRAHWILFIAFAVALFMHGGGGLVSSASRLRAAVPVHAKHACARAIAKLIPGVLLWGVDIVYRFFKVPHAQQSVQAGVHERFFMQIAESRKSLKITSLVELPGGIVRLVFAPVDPG